MLEINNISKTYNEKTILNNVSFHLEEGEILGISGKSGIGKSTLGKIIVGLEEADRGEIFYREEKIIAKNFSMYKDKKQGKKLRGEIQFIFQNPYSALDNKVKIKRLLLSSLKSRKKVIEDVALEEIKKLLKKSSLPVDVLEKYPSELSGGQRQRIIIIRAILLNPKILICDEITASLDVSVQNEILNLLLDLKDEYNLSYIFITHNRRILEKFCTRVIELK